MEKILIHAFADEASSIIDNQIIAMKRNNLNGLEIRNADGISCVALNAAEAKEIRRKLDDAGLTVWSMGSPIGKITLEDDFDKHMDVLRNGLEVANILLCIRTQTWQLATCPRHQLYTEQVYNYLPSIATFGKKLFVPCQFYVYTAWKTAVFAPTTRRNL